MKYPYLTFILATLVFYSSCKSNPQPDNQAQTGDSTATAPVAGDTLPAPYATESASNMSKVIGWENGAVPTAPEGFKVEKFADSLNNPRWIYIAPNGDVLVSEASYQSKLAGKVMNVISGKGKSANRITLFRDSNGDGKYDLRTTFFTGLDLPFGMAIVKDKFYVACADAVWVYPYKTGDTKISGAGKKITELPSGGRHWTRNIVANAEGSRLYVSIGSATDHAEDGLDKDSSRARIIVLNADGSGRKVFASGLRNPVGMAWNPATGELWAAVNERDELGDNLVPDYITSVKEGGFYGWPFSYYGRHADPRIKEEDKRPDLVEKAIVPDVPVGSHTASLGLAFYTAGKFPAKYHNGAFIGQRGSWNRSVLAGYRIAFVPFKNGKPAGPPEDFLTGFIANIEKSEVHGRPVGVAVAKDGALLVADDASNTVWRVSAK